MSAIKISIVGAGYMAEEHIKAFSDMDELKICGIFSRSRINSNLLAEKYKIAKVYDSIESMYFSTKSDLVLVAVSEQSLEEVCSEIFKFPWHSLIEKPIGYNYENSLKILRIPRVKGHFSFVAFNRRHYSSTRTVLAEVLEEESPRLVNILDQEYPEKAKEDGADKKVYENYMYCNSIHLIDYFNLFCRGSLQSVKPIIEFNKNQPLFTASYLEFSSGDIGIYQANWNAPGPWSVSISTSNKRWEMKPLESASFQILKSRKIVFYPIHEWDKLFKPGLRYQAMQLVNAYKGLAHSLPTLEDSLKSMNLVRMLYEK